MCLSRLRGKYKQSSKEKLSVPLPKSPTLQPKRGLLFLWIKVICLLTVEITYSPEGLQTLLGRGNLPFIPMYTLSEK